MGVRIIGIGSLGGMLLGTLVPLAAAPPRALFEPEKGCYIGAFVLKDPRIGGDMLLFERLTGRPHASYFTYVGYGQPFPSEWVEAVKEVGAVPHIAWEPNQGLEGVRDDHYLREWAFAARRARCPIFLRYASEMNGAWQKYHGDPALYIRKWRLVYTVMKEIAPNVALVWNPYCTPTRPIPSYYPGDEYVDWVGVNLYSVHHHNNDPRQPSDQEDPRELLRFVYALFSDRKPIMIGEFAATHFCLACGQPTVGFALEKMKQLYQSLPQEFPRVKMIYWFNWDTIQAGVAENNYALTDDERILQLYRELIRSPYFLDRIPYERESPAQQGALQVVEVPSELILPRQELPALSGGPDSSSAGPQDRSPSRVPGPEGGAVRVTPPRLRTPPAVVPPRQAPVELQNLTEGMEVSGKVTLRARVAAQLQVGYVLFRIDGEVVQITNRVPYQYLWNTVRFQPGEHTLQVAAVRPDGSEERSSPVKVTVRHE